MRERPYIEVYIVTNQPRGTLYTGVTSDLPRRARQHRDGVFPGFTKTYGLKRLVYLQRFGLITDAIHREKALKKYPRQWKCNLIERDNPNWDDLYYFG